MQSERITKMEFVFVNTSAEKKVSKTETEKTQSKDFNSYLKNDNKAASESTRTKNESTIEKANLNETKASEFKRLIREANRDDSDVNTVDEENAINPEVYAQVMGSIKDIMEILQATFNVTGQEIETAMSDLGITQLDLLTKNGLNDLLSKLAPNGEITNLLINSDFSKAVKDMFSVIENLKETLKSDFSLSEEEITNILKNLKENMGSSNEAKNIADLNLNTKQILTTENQNVVIEEENAYKTQETESSESNNNMGNKNSSNDFTQGIMNKITQALENSSTDDIDPVKIIKQVIDEIKLTVKQDMTKIEMQIYPEHLGKVSLQVMSKDGTVTAQIAAQTVAVKEAIESQLFTLKQNMEEQGIKVDSIEVTLASQGFEQNNQNNEDDLSEGSFRKSGFFGKLGENELEEELSLEEQLMNDSGSTVSYKA